MTKQIQTPDAVVRCEWSGNRANAWDTDGVKRTSEITVGARQKAADGDYLLGRFTDKNGKKYWKRWDGEIASPVHNSSSVEVSVVVSSDMMLAVSNSDASTNVRPPSAVTAIH